MGLVLVRGRVRIAEFIIPNLEVSDVQLVVIGSSLVINHYTRGCA
jgi:hypothetical protein